MSPRRQLAESFSWIKDHAGFWTFGLLIVAAVGLFWQVGASALDNQRVAIEKVVEAKEKTLNARIDGNKTLLTEINNRAGRIETKLDTLNSRIDSLLQNLPKR